MTVLKPPRLRRGDVIGLISPASTPLPTEKIEKGARYLEGLGYRVKLGEHVAAQHGYFAGTFLNSWHDRSYAAGLERSVHHGSMGEAGTYSVGYRLGAINYLNKPADAEEIEAALQGKRPPPMNDVPSLDRQEWEYLNRILADCNGNISEAARRLKMHRRTLQRKLQKHPPKA